MVIGKTQKEIANKSLGVHRTTVGKWIRDIREKQDHLRDYLIFRLRRLRWTPIEVAELLKIDHSRVSQIENLNFEKFLETQTSLLRHITSTITEVFCLLFHCLVNVVKRRILLFHSNQSVNA